MMRAGLRSDSTCGEVKSFLRAETLHSFPSPGAADRVAERRRPRQGCPPSLCRPVPRYEYKLQSRSRFWPMAGPLFCMAVLQLNFTRRPVTWSGVAEGSVRYRWRGTCAVRYIARDMELVRRLLNPPPPPGPTLPTFHLTLQARTRRPWARRRRRHGTREQSRTPCTKATSRSTLRWETTPAWRSTWYAPLHRFFLSTARPT